MLFNILYETLVSNKKSSQLFYDKTYLSFSHQNQWSSHDQLLLQNQDRKVTWSLKHHL